MASGVGQHALSAVFNLIHGRMEQRVQQLLVSHPGPDDFFGQGVEKETEPYCEYPVFVDRIYNVQPRGIGASEALPTDQPVIGATATQYPDFTANMARLSPTAMYARMTLSVPELVLSGNSSSMVNLLDLRARTQAEVLKYVRNEQWWGDGSGVLGRVHTTAAATATTVVLQRDDPTVPSFLGEWGARRLKKNRTFEVRRGGVKVGTFSYMVRDQNFSTGVAGTDNITITPGVEAGQSFLPGDVLVEADNNGSTWGRLPNGFLNIFDDGTNAPNYLGVSRLRVPRWGLLPELHFTTANASTGQNLTHPLLFRALSAFAEATGENSVTLVGRGEVLDELAWEGELRAASPAARSDFMADPVQAGRGQGPKVLTGGYSRVVFAHPDYPEGGVSFVRDTHAPYGVLLGFVPSEMVNKEWEAWHVETGYARQMPGGYYPNPAFDTVQARWRWMGNRHCLYPSHSMLLDRLLRRHMSVRAD